MAGRFELTDKVIQIIWVGESRIEVTIRILKQALRAARAAWQSNGNRPFHILVDLRDSTEMRNADELQRIAGIMSTFGDVLTGRIAVVVADPVRFALGRMFEIFVNQMGQTPGIFESIEEAETWLEAEPQA